MKICILVLALTALSWAYPTGEKGETLPAVPLVITDYSTVAKDNGLQLQKDQAPESAESGESSESEESAEVAKPPKPETLPAANPEPIASAPSEMEPKSSEETAPAKPLEPEVPAAPVDVPAGPATPETPEPVVEEAPKPSEEPIKMEMKTLSKEEEIPAPVALPTSEIKSVAPEKIDILEVASKPAAIAEDTIPLTAAKKEEAGAEDKPTTSVLKAAESKVEEIKSEVKPIEAPAAIAAAAAAPIEHLKTPVLAAEGDLKKPAEEKIEKIEEKKVEIVTDDKKEEPAKAKGEPEAVQEGRTVRDAIPEEAKPIEVVKKDEKLVPEIKKIDPVVEEASKVIEEKKPIVEDVKPATPKLRIADGAKPIEAKSAEPAAPKEEEKPIAAAEEIPKPLALPSAEATPELKKIAAEEKKEEAPQAEIKAPAAAAVAEELLKTVV